MLLTIACGTVDFGIDDSASTDRLTTIPQRSRDAPACGQGLWGAAFVKASIQRLMTAVDSSGATSRRRYALPPVDPDSIRLVTDEATCERAAHAYYRHWLGPQPLESVSVMAVADLYVVSGTRMGGEWSVLEIYTHDFQLVRSLIT